MIIVAINILVFLIACFIIGKMKAIAFVIASNVLLFSSCSTTESFTTTRTQLNFYEYPDTLHWEVKGDNIILEDHGKKIFINNKDGRYTIDSCKVYYKIEEASVWVKHW